MSGLSTTWANEILDHVTGNADAPTLVGLPYIGLSTTKPASDGTNVTEPSGGNYARVACNTVAWGAASARSIANEAAVVFATANGTWAAGVALEYWVIYTAITAGTLIMWGEITGTGPIVTSGMTPSFAIGVLTATIATDQ
ncbi:MAG: hypothetical protein V2A73_21295 [Pseudomonadota bacterium]